MKFQKLPIEGAFLIQIEPIEDERGFFARAFCRNEFEKIGLHTEFVQSNISFNKKKGTLRGMHYQAAPYEEVKLIRCISGSIYDAFIDLRPDSPTYKKWAAVHLSAAEDRMLYLPKGVAHGFQTLEENVKLLYQVSAPFNLEASRGVRWDRFGIEWPLEISVISKKDQEWS